MIEKNFINSLNENINLKKKLNSKKNILTIKKFIQIIFSTIKNNKKIMICGNGGSAADAQHLSAEFVVRLNPNKNRSGNRTYRSQDVDLVLKIKSLL